MAVTLVLVDRPPCSTCEGRRWVLVDYGYREYPEDCPDCDSERRCYGCKHLVRGPDDGAGGCHYGCARMGKGPVIGSEGHWTDRSDEPEPRWENCHEWLEVNVE